jgi:hypothetical protein
MTNNLDTEDLNSNPAIEKKSLGERVISRRYLLEFGLGMFAYAGFLVAALVWGNLDGDSPWRFGWALLPVLPLVWVAVAFIRHLRRVDAYVRQLLFQGLSAGFAVAMVAAVTCGFLMIAGLEMPDVSWIIFSAGMLGWAVARIIGNRR